MRTQTDEKSKQELSKMIASQSKKIFKKKMKKNFETMFTDDFVLNGKPVKAKVLKVKDHLNRFGGLSFAKRRQTYQNSHLQKINQKMKEINAKKTSANQNAFLSMASKQTNLSSTLNLKFQTSQEMIPPNNIRQSSSNQYTLEIIQKPRNSNEERKKLQIANERDLLIKQSYRYFFYGYEHACLLVNIDEQLQTDERLFFNQTENADSLDQFDKRWIDDSSHVVQTENSDVESESDELDEQDEEVQQSTIKAEA